MRCAEHKGSPRCRKGAAAGGRKRKMEEQQEASEQPASSLQTSMHSRRGGKAGKAAGAEQPEAEVASGPFAAADEAAEDAAMSDAAASPVQHQGRVQIRADYREDKWDKGSDDAGGQARHGRRRQVVETRAGV